MPIAPLSTMAGAYIVRRMRPQVFYPLSYATVGIFADHARLQWRARPACNVTSRALYDPDEA